LITEKTVGSILLARPDSGDPHRIAHPQRFLERHSCAPQATGDRSLRNAEDLGDLDL
jgi:hypothetical protein